MKPGAVRQAEISDREVLAGLVERVTFHNPENGFCVLRTKARGHRELVTVVGHAAMVSPGEWITASGEWVNDRTHGQQFKARFVRTSEPSSVEGIEKYLGSGMIRGIGPVYARKLVRAFGEKVFDVIEAEPERLREVAGIGKVRAKRITDAWAEQKVVREIMVFLHSHGVGTGRAVRVFRTYGVDAVEVMTENPYRLARDIRGIGFVTADAIAMKLGIAKTAMVRVRVGIGYALTEAMDEGHCGLPEEELGPLAAKLLEVPGELIRAALDLELAEGTVVADTVGEIPCILLGGLHRAERAIAGCLLGIATGNLPWPEIDPDKALPWVEGQTGLALAPGQADAVRAALSSKVSVITGGPGVGKTTIVNSILRILSAKGVDILLCAPTGRAAKRMSEATGLEAKTIHRLLEVDPRNGGFRRDAHNALQCGLLVIDETSMVDVMLMRALLAAVGGFGRTGLRELTETLREQRRRWWTCLRSAGTHFPTPPTGPSTTCSPSTRTCFAFARADRRRRALDRHSRSSAGSLVPKGLLRNTDTHFAKFLMRWGGGRRNAGQRSFSKVVPTGGRVGASQATAARDRHLDERRSDGRGRDTGCPAPPAQIRTWSLNHPAPTSGI